MTRVPSNPSRDYIGYVTAFLLERLPDASIRWTKTPELFESLHVHVQIGLVSADRLIDVYTLTMYQSSIETVAHVDALALLEKFTDPIEPP